MKKIFAEFILLVCFLFVFPIYFTNKITYFPEYENLSVKEDILTDIEFCNMLNVHTKDIETITLNDYLIGAIFAQMPANFEEETIKAQIVIAHTYILRQHEIEKANPTAQLCGADFSNDLNEHLPYYNNEEAKKIYQKDYEKYYNKINKCVSEVVNEVIFYNDQLIFPAFHYLSAEKTVSSQEFLGINIPYLASKESEFDKSYKNFENTKYITKEEFFARICTKYTNLNLSNDANNWVENIEKTPSNLVKEVTIEGVSFSGKEIAKILNIPSLFFDISYENNKFKITFQGQGNGLGLSQYGANEMAKSGKDYKQILLHYYDNVEIKSVLKKT